MLAASHDGQTCTVLDTTANGSGDLIQLAELQLSNGDTTAPPATDMRTFVTGRPVNGFNQRPTMGYSGRRSLQYSGGHLAAGRAYAYNKVFDVDIPGRSVFVWRRCTFRAPTAIFHNGGPQSGMARDGCLA